MTGVSYQEETEEDIFQFHFRMVVFKIIQMGYWYFFRVSIYPRMCQGLLCHIPLNRHRLCQMQKQIPYQIRTSTTKYPLGIFQLGSVTIIIIMLFVQWVLALV